MDPSSGSGAWPPLGRRLVFLVSPPRAGSTLLQRILHATGQVHTRPEPHLLTPLAFLGYYGRVDRAPYDPVVSARALQAFVRDLPGGEADYLQALRAYAGVLYGRVLESAPPGTPWFLDKTPAYALVPEFLARLYPEARFIVLTRHPAAVFTSYAESFFDGDFAAAAAFNPILARYVPKVAWLLRQAHLEVLHVRYEDLVTWPEEALKRICAFLDIPFSREALEYGRVPLVEGAGDPTGVGRHPRPVVDSRERWVGVLAGDEEKVRIVGQQLAAVTDEDLETWGVPRAALWAPLARAVAPAAPRRRRWDRHARERRLLLWLRRAARAGTGERILRTLHLATEVLLREGFGEYAPRDPAPVAPVEEDR